jgi:hypothetical protein
MGPTSERENRLAAGEPDYPPQGDESWRWTTAPFDWANGPLVEQFTKPVDDPHGPAMVDPLWWPTPAPEMVADPSLIGRTRIGSGAPEPKPKRSHKRKNYGAAKPE